MHTITFVTLYAYPDPEVGAKRVSELANHMAEQEWVVTMICREGPFNLEGGRLKPAIVRIGIPVPRTIYSYLKPLVPAALRGSKGGPSTAIADAGGQLPDEPQRGLIHALRGSYLDITMAIDEFKLWSVRALRRALKETRRNRPDILFCSGPVWSPVVAVIAAGCIRRIPVVLDFRDPWYRDDMSFGRIAATLSRHFERWCVMRSAMISCTSESICETLRQRYPQVAARVLCIRNGFDPGDDVHSPAPVGELQILFAGSIYHARNPMPLLEGLRLLTEDRTIDASRVHLTMVGDCRQWRGIDLSKWVSHYGLGETVTIGPAVSKDEVRQLTVASNVLANFSQGQKAMIPAKLFEQIAARRTVLLFAECDSESARCVEQVPDIIRLDEDPVKVRDTLRDLYDRYVRGQGHLAGGLVDVSAFSRSRSNDTFLSSISRILTQEAEPSDSGGYCSRDPV